MPKIIPDLKEKIIAGGRKLMLSGDPKALSLRAISNECGIAVGTVYNYFTGKDQLIVSVLMDDWLKALDKMQAHSIRAKSFEAGLENIYDDLVEFIAVYRKIWSGFSKGTSEKASMHGHHGEFMDQLGNCITLLANSNKVDIDADERRIICELLLIAVMQEDVSKESFVKFVSREIR